jgi:hypothetical protein
MWGVLGNRLCPGLLLDFESFHALLLIDHIFHLVRHLLVP